VITDVFETLEINRWTTAKWGFVSARMTVSRHMREKLATTRRAAQPSPPQGRCRSENIHKKNGHRRGQRPKTITQQGWEQIPEVDQLLSALFCNGVRSLFPPTSFLNFLRFATALRGGVLCVRMWRPRIYSSLHAAALCSPSRVHFLRAACLSCHADSHFSRKSHVTRRQHDCRSLSNIGRVRAHKKNKKLTAP
jgi:hypothetical protein